jgi:HEAT repeat protein
MKNLSPDQLVAKYKEIQDPSQKDVLAGLDAVDWQSLKHAHGEAGDVPALLCAVLSQDEDDRMFAFHLLFGSIRHQGSVYEASAYAVPFLFQMLRSPKTPDKTTVAGLLASLALGSPGTNKEPKYRWVNATRDAVEKELQLLYPFLQDPDEEIRGAIAVALSSYPGHSEETIPLLEHALGSESDGFIRTTMQNSIDKLRDTSSA